MSSDFPEPDAQARAVSDRLVERIRADIERQGGWIGFERYMQLALYEPGLGYYSGGSTKLGSAGDFVTAPEISDLFGRALARQLLPLLGQLAAPRIVEFGAGSGRLAETILAALETAESIRPQYLILEPSADLKDRQRSRLAAFSDQVTWLERLPPAPLEAVVLANEVLDAFPVKRFLRRDDGVRPLGVRMTSNGFDWEEGPNDSELSAALAVLEDRLGQRLPAGFRSEISPDVAPWFEAIAALIERGAVLLVDYGLVRREYYHRSRSDGTLVCHYRHRAHTDPFLYPGLQDISAWVDFSACADAALASGFPVSGFTTQGQLLLEGGSLDFLEAAETRAGMEGAKALKTLVLPGEMGERFKLLLLSRGVEGDLPGRDFRDRL